LSFDVQLSRFAEKIIAPSWKPKWIIQARDRGNHFLDRLLPNSPEIPKKHLKTKRTATFTALDGSTKWLRSWNL